MIMAIMVIMINPRRHKQKKLYKGISPPPPPPLFSKVFNLLT